MGRILFLIFLAAPLIQCTKNKAELGSAANPIKMFFVPSVDVKAIEDNSKAVQTYLEAKTKLHFKMSIPTSYVAVVEARDQSC